MVGKNFLHDKGSNITGSSKKGGLILPDDFTLDILKPLTISSRFDVEQIREKLQRAFLQNNLKNIKFEFALLLWQGRQNLVFQKASTRILAAFEDTLNKYPTNIGLEALSGKLPAKTLCEWNASLLYRYQ